MLGWEMLQAVYQAGTVRARWVTCAEAFGRESRLLDQIDTLGLWYLAEVPHDTQVWRQRPATGVPVWSGQGRNPTRGRVLAGAGAPQTVAQLAAALPAHGGTRRTIKEGSKGPLVAHVAVLRVLAVREGGPGPEGWLGRRRNLLTGELKTYLRTAPADTPLTTLVRVLGRRGPIDTCCADGKQHVGMGAYEGRSWRGWHHHRTRCILAHVCLVRMCLQCKKKRQA